MSSDDTDDSDGDLSNYKTEIYTVEIVRHIPSGIAISEEWRNEKGKNHRPPQDGPAVISRSKRNGQFFEQTYVVDGKWVEPEMAGITRPPPQEGKPKELAPG